MYHIGESAARASLPGRPRAALADRFYTAYLVGMKPTMRTLLAPFLGAVLLTAGCLTHTFQLDLTSENPATLTIEGDSLDLVDGRLALPDRVNWALVSEESSFDPDSNRVIERVYQATAELVPHHLAPPGEQATLSYSHGRNWLLRRPSFRMILPSWRVYERWGDPRGHVPDAVSELQVLDDRDSLLSDMEREELDRQEARALQKAASERYLRQMSNLLDVWARQDGSELDSTIRRDALERFSAILQAHVMTLQHRDPLDVSLEWYPQLREPMAISAAEATGGEREPFLAIADSLELDHKRWEDLKDDRVRVLVVMDTAFRIAEPDSSYGDTLLWEFPGELLADSTIVLSARGYTPSPMAFILLLALIAVLALYLFRKQLHLTKNSS